MGFLLTILILTVVCFMVGAFLDEFDNAAIGCGVIGLVTLVAALFALPISRNADRDLINTIESTGITLAKQRTPNVNPLENVKITEKIIDLNSDLAKRKWWVGNFWYGWYYIDDLKKVNPL